MKTGVYTITNTINGKIYVGSALLTFNKRKNQHYSDLSLNKHSNPHLQRAYNKYGKDNFVFEILEYYNVDIAVDMENYWVNILNTRDQNIGYNILSPTNGRLGMKHSDESKQKMSISQAGEKHRLYGKTLSAEIKAKISESHKGLKHSEESKKKMSLSRKGTNIGKNNPFYGKKHTKETLLLISSKIDYTLRYKKILQFNMNGDFIKEFDSLKDAKKELNITSCGGLGIALRNFNRSYKGFRWKYK